MTAAQARSAPHVHSVPLLPHTAQRIRARGFGFLLRGPYLSSPTPINLTSLFEGKREVR